MTSDEAFVLDLGPLARKFPDALSERRRAVARQTEDFLDRDYWAFAHAKGLGYVRLITAVDRLLTYALVEKPTDLIDEAALLSEQRAIVGGVDWTMKPAGTAHITVANFYTAAAVIPWARDEAVDRDALSETLRIGEEWRARQGGLLAVLDGIGQGGGWQRTRALTFARDFVCHAMLGDWAWLDEVYRVGFGHLDGAAQPSASGLLVRFCASLARTMQIPLNAAPGDARKALEQCAYSWATAIVRGEPWDTPLILLYLAVAAHEHWMSKRSLRFWAWRVRYAVSRLARRCSRE